MGIEIRRMESGLLEDYLHFFDDVAFTDHKEWAWCYCTFFHLSKEDEGRIEKTHRGSFTRDVLRDIAIGFVKDGTLNGYLAYDAGEAVGWLNAADKGSYAKLRESAELWEDGADAKTKAITCFIVAPDMRRRGVATALLRKAVEDAAREGYRYAEAYPAGGEHDCYHHYHGHRAMYEKCGFRLHKVCEGYSIFRKELG